MKKLLSIIFIVGLLALPVMTEEKKPEKKLQYKVPKIEQVAIYPDIGAMAICVDGEMYLFVYYVGFLKLGKCQSEEF